MSFTDYVLRHHLEEINILSDDGLMINSGEFEGMKRFDARYEVIKKLKEKGLYTKAENNPMNIPMSSRSKDVSEPGEVSSSLSFANPILFLDHRTFDETPVVYANGRARGLRSEVSGRWRSQDTPRDCREKLHPMDGLDPRLVPIQTIVVVSKSMVY